MGRDTIETVRDFFERRNQGVSDELVAMLHPDVEFDLSRSRSPYRGIYRGKEKVTKLFEEVGEAWAEVRWMAEEFIEIGDDSVVVPTRLSGRGQGSGIELGGRGAGIYSVKDGKLSRFVLCQDTDEAIKVAGDLS